MSAAAQSTRAGTFCVGFTPWSARNRRTSVTRRSMSAIRRAASASGSAPPFVSSCPGHAATTMLPG